MQRTSRRGTRACVSLAALVVVAGSMNVEGQRPQPEATQSLVRRNQVQMTLAGAQRAVVVSRERANEIGVSVNIAVVDDGGHLLAFARMDGARPGSVYTSMTKATSAATKRGETGPLPSTDATDTHLSLAVENAAAVSGGKFTTLEGGVPIVIDGQVIGAIGVGGATGEQDADVAKAGVEALTKEIGSSTDVKTSTRTGSSLEPKSLVREGAER